MKVTRSHLFGSSSGTLRITADGIEYDTTANDDARRWPYPEIKQLQIRSPKRMAVLTYEDQGRLKLGADRTFEFEVQGGRIYQRLGGVSARPRGRTDRHRGAPAAAGHTSVPRARETRAAGPRQ